MWTTHTRVTWTVWSIFYNKVNRHLNRVYNTSESLYVPCVEFNLEKLHHAGIWRGGAAGKRERESEGSCWRGEGLWNASVMSQLQERACPVMTSSPSHKLRPQDLDPAKTCRRREICEQSTEFNWHSSHLKLHKSHLRDSATVWRWCCCVTALQYVCWHSDWWWCAVQLLERSDWSAGHLHSIKFTFVWSDL